MIAHLRIEAGVQAGSTFTLKDGERMFVGRDRKNDYALGGNLASRVHCRLENREGVLTITDLQSKNGTRVNGALVESRPLRDDDVIEVAHNRLRVRLEREAAPGAKAKEGPLFIIPKPVQPPPGPVAAVATTLRRDLRSTFTEDERALVGRTLAGIYIAGPVYAGDRTRVFRGTHKDTNKVVAITLLPQVYEKNPNVIHWFIEGARRAGRMQHEDAVSVLGGGTVEKMYFYYARFMTGGNAEQAFRRDGAPGQPGAPDAMLLVKKALQTTIHAARALEFANGQGVWHLGVRPTKLVYDRHGAPKLLGLGFDNGPGPGFNADGPGAAYLAPEQRGSAPAPHAATDIYGLGATFYYLLAGQPPKLDAAGRAASPQDLNPAVPLSLCRIVERMMAPDPKQRYPSFGQVVYDLRRALVDATNAE